MRELWRDVPGFGGYIVSSYGQVMSLPRLRADGQPISGRILQQSITPNGYSKVTLFKEGIPNQISVHRLVMLAFVGPSDLQVNHKDENKTNNRLDNLEYLTGKDNTRYSCAEPVECYDLVTGITIKKYKAAADARQDGHNPGAISNVCLGKSGFRSHHGLGWRFADAKCCGENRTSSRTPD